MGLIWEVIKHFGLLGHNSIRRRICGRARSLAVSKFGIQGLLRGSRAAASKVAMNGRFVQWLTLQNHTETIFQSLKVRCDLATQCFQIRCSCNSQHLGQTIVGWLTCYPIFIGQV